VTSEQAKGRALADAEEYGWSVVESHWYPRLVGEGGVLVVEIREARTPPADSGRPGSPRSRGSP